MIDRAYLLTLEELQRAPDTAMLYLEYRVPMQFHKSGTRRVSTIRAMNHPEYLAANYGIRFRCWARKPGPEDLKANEWRNDQE